MTTTDFITNVLDGFYRAEQVDLLHVALTNLLEMVSAGEIDIYLEQHEKTAAQKKAFIQKIVSDVESPELKKALEERLKENDLEFFRERNLGGVLAAVQRVAETIQIVKLRVAVSFKEKDLQDMVKQLEEQLGTEVALELSVERSLLGGAIVQFGTAIRDYSIKSRLETVRETWKAAVVEA